MRYIPIKMTKDGRYNLSPFVVRTGASADPVPSSSVRQTPKKKSKPRKGIIEFPGFKEKAEVEEADRRQREKNTTALRGWLPNTSALLPSLHTPAPERSTSPTKPSFSEPALGSEPPRQLTMQQAVDRALNPTENERSEYERYMSHPLHLPLVISSEPSARDRQSVLVRALVKYVDSPGGRLEVGEEDRQVYEDNVDVPENPLKVDVEDGEKKRYLAYGSWVKTGRLKRQGRGGG